MFVSNNVQGAPTYSHFVRRWDALIFGFDLRHNYQTSTVETHSKGLTIAHRETHIVVQASLL